MPFRKNIHPSFICYHHGWFFVTIQANFNQVIFGAIVENRMVHNSLGSAVVEAWRSFPEHAPELVLDEFVLMPNHFHAVLQIRDQPTNKEQHLAYLIGRFKSYTSHLYLEARKSRLCPDIGASLWQRDYWDIATSRHERLESYRTYIRHNPANWDYDRFGPVTVYHRGNMDLLNGELTGFVASQGTSAEQFHPILQWGQTPEPGMPRPPVISTFTSEQECGILSRLLSKERSVIQVFPGGIPETPSREIAAACEAGRALLLSPVPAGTGRNKQRAVWCNKYVLECSANLWTGDILPGHTLETLIKEYSKKH